jgi:hypothetical protein
MEDHTVDNKYATRSTTHPGKDSLSWIDEQRRIKEDRKVRSRKKPVESAAGEVLINELNRSLIRIQQGYGVPSANDDEATMDTSITSTKRVRPTPSTLSNRIATGFHSPFKSPKIASFESPITFCSTESEPLNVISSINLSKYQDGTANNLLVDISGFDPNVSQVK